MQCIGNCKKYKSKINTYEGGRYEQGQKRCHKCETFITWEGLWCPCCGHLLRTKPRATKPKRRISLMRKRRKEDFLEYITSYKK